MLKSILSQVQEGDLFVTVDLKDAYFHIQVVRRHRKFLRFAFRGKAYQYNVLPFGLALSKDVHQVYGCSSGPAETPGHPNPQLPGRLAYLSQLQGAGDSSQGLSPSPPSRTWPLAEWPEERAHPSPADHFFGSLPGLNLDAGPSGPCSGKEDSVMHGPLQARSARVSGPVSQAPRSHGGSFPGSSLGTAPYETFLWVSPWVFVPLGHPFDY